MTTPDRAALLPVLDDLAAAVEDVVATGLTSASQATLQRLDVSFREASRLKLGRLAASLRYVNEEIARHLRHADDFSAWRLSLFLNRSWVLARGLAHAARTGDDDAWRRLTWSPAPEPLGAVEVVCLGVRKRTTRVSGSFDFAFREVGGPRHFVWSLVFSRESAAVPPETQLHTRPKNVPPSAVFEPSLFTEAAPVTFAGWSLVPDGRGGGRLWPAAGATVTAGKRADWAALLEGLRWDCAAAVARARAHDAGPLDLPVELQEDVVLREWTVGAPVDRGRPGVVVYPMVADGLEIDAVVSTQEDGRALRTALDELRKAKARPPLVGLLHSDLCRLVLEPLSLLRPAGPEHLMLAKELGDKRAMVRDLFSRG
ncbi:MAG: hypothetical protein R3F59_31535 [Myxococcota bacterium]